MAYRWFLGLGLMDKIPSHTTFGKNYARRFADSDVFEKIFERILLEDMTAGFVDASAIFIDDSVMFDDLYSDLIEKFPEIEAVGVDGGYKTPWIMKQVFDSGRLAVTPYKRPMTKDGFFKKYDYAYDEFYDCIICPENQVLKYTTTNREGYKEFKSDPKICEKCPLRHKCTESKNHQKVVNLHVWHEYMELAEDVRLSPKGKEQISLKQIKPAAP